MDRDDFRELATLRLDDATVLLESGRFAATYCLAGYVVECALKACIATQTKEYEFPDKRRVSDSYTHDLEKLVGVAGLDDRLTEAMDADSRLAQNWAYVKDWSEESRYEQAAEPEARDLLRAVADPAHGVLAWLRAYW